jgi:hypothetical protein
MTDRLIDDALVEKAMRAVFMARAKRLGLPASRVSDTIHSYGFGDDLPLDVRAVLSAVVPEIVGRLWRPIETAPEDLTSILVRCSEDFVFAAQYECHATPPFWSADVLDLVDGGVDITTAHTLTHWMPLPPSPAASIRSLTSETTGDA